MAGEYATFEEYKGSTDTPVDEADRTRIERDLRTASRLMRELTVTAVYATDTDGMPTDPRIADAFKDAVCAQVEWFAELGDSTGAIEQFQGGSLGSLSLNGSARTPDRDRYAPNAVLALQDAGLILSEVAH